MEDPFDRQEETLDPENWDEMRALGHRMLDDMLDYLRDVRERPVWQPLPQEVKDGFNQPLPQEPAGAAQAYADFQEQILPYPMGNIHPRFWGWVIGTGTPSGALSEMLAATINPNMGGGDHGGVYVEAQVIDWCKEMMGFPADASGILVSGGSMANLVGLTAARNHLEDVDVRVKGVAAAPRPLVVYASAEVHSSVQKAVELLGLGSQSLHLIPVNDDFQIDLASLEATLAADLAAGLRPFCVVGCAGTVNTGAFDDLNALADFSQRNGLWFHVDGAFGALAVLSPALRGLVRGMERADSLAFDLHKWIGAPMDVGCALVRSEEAHRHAFSLTPDYLAHSARGLAGGQHWFSEYSFELTRSFRALKVWMTFKEHGVQKFGRVIQQNVDQARYLAQKVDADPHLERLAPAPLNIVCFRYVVPGMSDEELNAFNQELMIRVHESGLAASSYTMIKGCYALRVANVNHRSRREDFDILVDEVDRLGEEMLREKDAAA